jgi:hypothetical protein
MVGDPLIPDLVLQIPDPSFSMCMLYPPTHSAIIAAEEV